MGERLRTVVSCLFCAVSAPFLTVLSRNGLRVVGGAFLSPIVKRVVGGRTQLFQHPTVKRVVHTRALSTPNSETGRYPGSFNPNSETGGGEVNRSLSTPNSETGGIPGMGTSHTPCGIPGMGVPLIHTLWYTRVCVSHTHPVVYQGMCVSHTPCGIPW